MTAFKGFTTRNILVYLKNKQRVFFSMLAPIIVFVLYMMFLRNNYIDSINSSMGTLESLIHTEDIDSLVNALILSGIVGSSLITVPFGTLQIIVEDRESQKDRDILATPVNRSTIILGYFTSSALCALFIILVLLTVGLVILSLTGNAYWTAENILSVYGIVLLGTLSSTAISMAVMLLFKTTSACGAFGGILSAAAGFVIGAYIPISQFSTGVQTFCYLWPTSQICVLMRQSLMDPLLEHINTGIGGLDQGQFVQAIHQVFGFEATINGNAFTQPNIVIYVTMISILCIMIDAAVYARIYKRK